MSANILFINETLLKSRTAISDSIDGKQLKPQIKLAQDMYVQPALGSTLYLRLQAGVEADNLSATESSLIDNYITDMLIWYTMSLLPMSLGYQFFSKGVLQKTAEESNTPSRAELESISTQYKMQAEFYKQRMIDYLRQNYTLFSEYYLTGVGLDTIFPETRAYTCPIWLGGVNVPSDSRGNGMNISSGAANTIWVTPAIGASSFSITGLPGNAVILIVTRSGQVKGVTNAATTNTLYLQINGSVCTLPTGDTVQDDGFGSGEPFSFIYR
jgi:hypothetical protein